MPRWCSVLQCVAVCCSVLQCVAVCCSVLQCVAVCWWSSSLGLVCHVPLMVACCSVLQCVAVCCSVLQCRSRLSSSVEKRPMRCRLQIEIEWLSQYNRLSWMCFVINVFFDKYVLMLRYWMTLWLQQAIMNAFCNKLFCNKYVLMLRLHDTPNAIGCTWIYHAFWYMHFRVIWIWCFSVVWLWYSNVLWGGYD